MKGVSEVGQGGPSHSIPEQNHRDRDRKICRHSAATGVSPWNIVYINIYIFLYIYNFYIYIIIIINSNRVLTQTLSSQSVPFLEFNGFCLSKQKKNALLLPLRPLQTIFGRVLAHMMNVFSGK